MKTLTKLFTLLLFVSFLASCTAENVDNDQQNDTEAIYATSANSSPDVDDDRD